MASTIPPTDNTLQSHGVKPFTLEEPPNPGTLISFSDDTEAHVPHVPPIIQDTPPIINKPILPPFDTDMVQQDDPKPPRMNTTPTFDISTHVAVKSPSPTPTPKTVIPFYSLTTPKPSDSVIKSHKPMDNNPNKLDLTQDTDSKHVDQPHDEKSEEEANSTDQIIQTLQTQEAFLMSQLNNLTLDNELPNSLVSILRKLGDFPV